MEDNEFLLIKKEKTNKLSVILFAFTFGIISMYDLASQYYFKDYLLIQPSTVQYIHCILAIPWAIKPLFGILTDNYPILSYKRKSYLMICGLISSSMWLLMAFTDVDVYLFVLFLFIQSCSLSFITVIAEGVVVEMSKYKGDLHKEKGSKSYVSLFFLCRFIGALIASMLKGNLLEYIPPKSVFFIVSFFPILVMVGGVILLETKTDSKYYSTTYKQKHSLFSFLLVYIRKKAVYIPLIYIIIVIGTPSLSDPMFYYFTNVLLIRPYQFSIISFFSILSVLLAIGLYQNVLSNVKTKYLLIFSSTSHIIFTFLAFLLIYRINIELGIPDLPFIVISLSVLSLFGEITSLPFLTLASSLCPSKYEATAYSIFISVFNFGIIVGNLSGGVLTQLLGVNANNFDNLSLLVLVSNLITIFPILMLVYADNKVFSHNQVIKITDSELDENLLDNHKQVEMLNISANENKLINY